MNIKRNIKAPRGSQITAKSLRKKINLIFQWLIC